jgi:hypothetical protein
MSSSHVKPTEKKKTVGTIMSDLNPARPAPMVCTLHRPSVNCLRGVQTASCA